MLSRGILPARRAYLTATMLDAFARGLIFLGLTAYYVRDIGMNPLQLVLVGTVVEATCFLFEVPTGVLADTVSRKLSVVIGGVLVGACYMLTGALPLFGAVIAAEIVRGVGETFLSGAYEAWITDEVGAENVGPVLLRAEQIGRVSGLAGGGAAVLLATWFGYAAPIFAGGALLAATFAAMFVLMPEHGFQPTPREDRSTFAQMAHTFTRGAAAVRASTVLLLLLAVEFIFGAASEGFDRLWEAHLLTSFTLPALSLPGIGVLDPIAWFALFNAAMVLLSVTLLEAARRRLDMSAHTHTARILMILNTATIAATLGFAFAGRFAWAAAALVLRVTFTALLRPLQSAWLNQHIPSAVRATVLSMYGQGNALGQIAGGPGVGWVGARYGVRAAIGLSALLLAPAVALWGRRRKS
jgi:DHA3 family tetracycline resistance protein-like MFS transporter